MNIRRFSFLLSLLVFCAYACNTSEKMPESTNSPSQESLLDAISAFNNAFRVIDISILDSLTTPSYAHTNGNARAIKKQEWLNYLKRRKADLDSGKLKINHYAMSETQIDMIDNAACVTAKITVDSELEGQEIENEYRVSNFWVYENGTWKRAGFHDAKIK